MYSLEVGLLTGLKELNRREVNARWMMESEDYEHRSRWNVMPETTELDRLYEQSRALSNDIAFLSTNIETNVVSINEVNVYDLMREKERELYDVNVKISKLEQ